MLIFLFCCVSGFSVEATDLLRIGWASIDITPSKPVLLRGQFYARLSEGVHDPLCATALALESYATDKPTRIVMVTCEIQEYVKVVPFDKKNISKETLNRLKEMTPSVFKAINIDH